MHHFSRELQVTHLIGLISPAFGQSYRCSQTGWQAQGGGGSCGSPLPLPHSRLPPPHPMLTRSRRGECASTEALPFPKLRLTSVKPFSTFPCCCCHQAAREPAIPLSALSVPGTLSQAWSGIGPEELEVSGLAPIHAWESLLGVERQSYQPDSRFPGGPVTAVAREGWRNARGWVFLKLWPG